MPLYEYLCPGCDTQFECLNDVAHRDHARCPSCRARADKIVTMPAVVRLDPYDWRNENGGRGRYISGLQATPGPEGSDGNAYCTSQAEAISKAEKMGRKAEKVG